MVLPLLFKQIILCIELELRITIEVALMPWLWLGRLFVDK